MKKLNNNSMLLIFLLLPICSFFLPNQFDLSIKNYLSQIICFSILALGINYSVTNLGILNLGAGGFMAVGAYTCSILVTTIYPFQFNYFIVYLISLLFGGIIGLVLSALSLRLKGDYLAIITLGFAEVIQDIIKNLDVITKGTKGINPLLQLSIFNIEFSSSSWKYYYLLLLIFFITNLFFITFSKSILGKKILAVKDDEIAASTLGLNPIKYRTIGLIISGAFCSLAGAIYVTTLGTSGEPGNYDFSISVLALAIVVLSANKFNYILLASFGIILFTNLLLPSLSDLLISLKITNSDSLILNSNNWKYFIFGLILILTMHWRSYAKNR